MSEYQSIFRDEIDYTILDRIKSELFSGYEDTIGINLECSNSSNSILDNRFMFGTWAGPTAKESNLLHEIGHFVEIDDARCHLPDWGLKGGKWIEVCGRYINEGMTTKKAVEREIRTIGIALVLHEHFGLAPMDEDVSDSRYWAEVCQYIDGYYLFKPENYREQDISYKESEKLAFDEIERLILEEKKKWTVEKVYNAWHEKMKVLIARQKEGCWNDWN